MHTAVPVGGVVLTSTAVHLDIDTVFILKQGGEGIGERIGEGRGGNRGGERRGGEGRGGVVGEGTKYTNTCSVHNLHPQTTLGYNTVWHGLSEEAQHSLRRG